jgi:hypothetical protein
MSKIFLVNVGANLQHQSRARSPIFDDDRFVFVTFPLCDDEEQGRTPYPPAAHQYIRNVGLKQTHADPDWDNLTYGDDTRNGRAAALKRAVPDDILLFWALLWRNRGSGWKDFTGDKGKGWYLIGALRIDEILREGQRPTDAKPSNVERAKKNAHFDQGVLDKHNLVFIGSKSYSSLFPRAVEFIGCSDLMFRTVRTASGEILKPNGGVHWSSSLRSCRAVWDLNNSEQRSRANIVRNEILQKTGFDLLRNINL